MKLMLLIEMIAIALLGVPYSAVMAAFVAGGEGHKNPDLGSAFRSDSTLGFMRKLHQNTAIENQANAQVGRSQQPGYGSKSDKKANQEDLIPDGLQQGPQYNSKKAQKAASKIGDDEAEPKGAAELDAPDSLQKGPQYDSKESQKATNKATNKREKAGPREGESLTPFGKTVSDTFKEAQKGPNYDKKAPAKVKEEPSKPEKAPAMVKEEPSKPEKPQGLEEPEEKLPARDISSVPGCRNSPRDWTDSKDRDCEDYAEGEWCSRSGGYGDGWLDEWGTFEDAATRGKSAKQACCVCGGGSSDELAREIASKKHYKAGTGPDMPLQEQGYSGELVAHEDQVTMTEDWGREFGPHSGHRDIKTICAEKPGNEWCSLHGYYDKKKPQQKSSASTKSLVAVLATLLFACTR